MTAKSMCSLKMRNMFFSLYYFFKNFAQNSFYDTSDYSANYLR